RKDASDPQAGGVEEEGLHANGAVDHVKAILQTADDRGRGTVAARNRIRILERRRIVDFTDRGQTRQPLGGRITVQPVAHGQVEETQVLLGEFSQRLYRSTVLIHEIDGVAVSSNVDLGEAGHKQTVSPAPGGVA